MGHMDVSPCMATITKTGVNKRVLCISSSEFNNMCAFETKPIPLDNLPAKSICFCHVFVIYINTSTVGIAHFINGTSISRATWVTLFYLGNIVNEYWCESSFPLSQTDISFIALTTNLDIFSVSFNIKKLSVFFVEQAIPFNRDKGI